MLHALLGWAGPYVLTDLHAKTVHNVDETIIFRSCLLESVEYVCLLNILHLFLSAASPRRKLSWRGLRCSVRSDGVFGFNHILLPIVLEDVRVGHSKLSQENGIVTLTSSKFPFPAKAHCMQRIRTVLVHSAHLSPHLRCKISILFLSCYHKMAS